MRWMGKALRENSFDYTPMVAFDTLAAGDFELARIKVEAKGESDE